MVRIVAIVVVVGMIAALGLTAIASSGN